MKKLLSLRFKGDRKYIQGGDIFNALADVSYEIRNQDKLFINKLVFRRFAHHACQLTTDKPKNMGDVVGQVQFKSLLGKGVVDGWVEEKDTFVSDRHDFDESLLLSSASLEYDIRSATLSQRSIYTPIEDVIALTKYLNYSITPKISGSWVFGQLNMTEPLINNYQSLTIRMKNLIDSKFSMNEIILDGRQVGVIQFIVGSP